MRCIRAIFGISKKLSDRNNRAGFTLIEIAVTITLFSAILTTITVNWISFTRQQEVRSAAHNLHNELRALKARALEDGVNYRITYPTPNSYAVSRRNDDNTQWVQLSTVTLPNRVVITNGFSEATPPTVCGEGNCSCPSWNGTTGIIVQPNNLNSFASGRVGVTSTGREGTGFCVAVTGNEINPRIFFRNRQGAAWGER